ncbi:hypothetical protein ACE4RR_07825 [Alteribacillus sp. HJP-4]
MISSLQADAFRGLDLSHLGQLTLLRRLFRKLFPRRTGRASVDVGHRTWPVLIDPESPPSVLQSKNKHHKGDLAFLVLNLLQVKDRTKAGMFRCQLF